MKDLEWNPQKESFREWSDRRSKAWEYTMSQVERIWSYLREVWEKYGSDDGWYVYYALEAKYGEVPAPDNITVDLVFEGLVLYEQSDMVRRPEYKELAQRAIDYYTRVKREWDAKTTWKPGRYIKQIVLYDEHTRTEHLDHDRTDRVRILHSAPNDVPQYSFLITLHWHSGQKNATVTAAQFDRLVHGDRSGFDAVWQKEEDWPTDLIVLGKPGQLTPGWPIE